MKLRAILILSGLTLIGLPGCANHPPLQTFMVPPRVDLRPHEMIGVVEFDSTNEGELGPLATRRFIEWARRDQGVVRIVELGPKRRALRSIGQDRWDAETLKALGKERGIRTILTGKLRVSDVKPDVRILASMGSGHVSARVEASLDVQLVETATGASIWSASASGIKEVGHVSVFSGGKFAFDAADPEQSYGALVDALVEQATRDFRVTWETR